VSAKRPPLRVLALSTLLLGTGTLHFLLPGPFDAIMPRALPQSTHRPLTYASGVAELTAGSLLLFPRTRGWGGWLAFWTLLGVFPANIDVALRGGYSGLSGIWGSAAAAWARLPLQLPLLWLSWSIARQGCALLKAS